MESPRSRGRIALAVLAATFALIGWPVLNAQDTAPAQAPESALSAALATTESQGAATVVVFTATDQPDSVRFWSELNGGAWARAHRGLVQFVNVSKDDEPDLV